MVAAMLSMASCSESQRREADDHNGREDGPTLPLAPDDSRLSDEDMKQLTDNTERFTGLGITISYGTPGVLLVEDGESVTLRELGEKGHCARFSTKTRSISLDGVTVGSDAVMISEELSMQWWRAKTTDESAVYFIINNN